MRNRRLIQIIRSIFAEALSSDEDEVDEFGNSYLENLENFATKKATENGVEMSAEVKEDEGMSDSHSKKSTKSQYRNQLFICADSDEDDDDDDDFDETTLETYVTPIDDDKSENPIDEYITFCEVMHGKIRRRPVAAIRSLAHNACDTFLF